MIALRLQIIAIAIYALLYAAEHNHIHMIHDIISGYNIPVESQDPITGKTALHLAVGKNYHLMVVALLQLRASMSMQDKKGNTVFHDAVGSNNDYLIPTLLQEEGQKPGHRKETCSLNIPNKAGHTPLSQAVHDLATKNKNVENKIFFALIGHNGIAVDKPDSDGITPIQHACQTNHGSLVKALVNAGAPLPANALALANKQGNTAVKEFLQGHLGKKVPSTPAKRPTPKPRPRYGDIPD